MDMAMSVAMTVLNYLPQGAAVLFAMLLAWNLIPQPMWIKNLWDKVAIKVRSWFAP